MKVQLGARAEGIIREVAPSLGKALGGPLGGLAAREITDAILGDDPNAPNDLGAAIEGLDTSGLKELRELDQRFAMQMEELGVRLHESDAADRNSARNRQQAMGDYTPAILGGLVIAGFFGVLAALMFLEVPANGERVLNVMIGALGSMSVQVMNFFFGSSAGSSRKNDILERRLLQDVRLPDRASARAAIETGGGGLY